MHKELSHSSPIFSDYSLEGLKWAPKGMLTGLAFFMLNLETTLLMYSTCDNIKVLAALSLLILIPRIGFATPRFFIANYFENSQFKLYIYCILEPTISLSFTYKIKIIKLSLNFLI